MNYQQLSSLEDQYKKYMQMMREGDASSSLFAKVVRLSVQLQLFDHARKHLENGLLAHPNSYVLLKEAGTLEAIQGNNERALGYFNKCLELNPSFTGALINKGSLYLRMGKTDDALAAHRLAVEFSPQSPLEMKI